MIKGSLLADRIHEEWTPPRGISRRVMVEIVVGTTWVILWREGGPQISVVVPCPDDEFDLDLLIPDIFPVLDHAAHHARTIGMAGHKII